MAGLSSAIRGWRLRYAVRRARDWYQWDLHGLTGVDWSGQTRSSVAKALRAWNVRTAAGVVLPGRRALFWMAFVSAGVAGTVGPFALVWLYGSDELTSVRLVLALTIYATIGATAFGLLASWGATGRQRVFITVACRLGVAISLATGVSTVAYLVAHRRWDDLWPAISVGLIASVLGLAVAFAIQAVAIAVAAVGTTVSCRRCGSMPPSLLVAVQAFYVLETFDELTSGWRQADTRKLLMWRIAGRANFIRHQIPRLQWLVGGSGLVHAETQQRCRQAADLLAHMQWRLAEARSRKDYDEIRQDLVEFVAAAVEGDWSRLAEDSGPVTRPSRLGKLARRLVAPVVLVGTAVGLPYLPGIPAGSSGVTTIQIGLVVAAVLTLASVDSSAQDRVLGALGGAGGPRP
jgi:hypothetical protein